MLSPLSIATAERQAMEKLYFLFFMRPMQLLGVVFVLGGLRHMPPFLAAVAQAFAGKADLPTICGKLVAVTLPCIAGGLWIWFFQYFVDEERRLRLGLQTFPDEPWMINPMWAAKHIRRSNRSIIIGFSIALGSYVLVALPYAVFTRTQSPPLLVGAPALVMLLLARMYWLKRKWNQAELRLGTLPGIVGGPFSGVVILHEEFPPDTSFAVSLRCERLKERDSNAVVYIDKSEGTTHWSSVLHINKTLKPPQPGTTAIPVSFAIPFNSPSTTLKTPMGESTIRWKLSVTLKNSPDLGGCVFEVPVFKTAQSRPNYRFDEDEIAPYYESVDPLAVAIRTRSRRTTLPDGTERWDFSLFSLGGLLFFIGLTIIAALSLSAALIWFRPWPITLFVGFFSAAFVAIGVYGLIETVLWASSIVATRDELTIKSGIFGCRRTVAAPRDSRTKLECELDFRKGNGEWWCLYVQPPPQVLVKVNGQVTTRYVTMAEDADEPDDLDTIPTPRLKLVKRLDGRVEAEAFQAWLAEQLVISDNT